MALVVALLSAATVHASDEYYHTDALGSVVAVTNEYREVAERSEYEPYGALVNRPLEDGPGYTGHVSDAATGLSYMQQRYYDPQIGRFLSVDPVTADGSTGGNFNRYWYANNNPYKFTDPDGRESACVSMGNCLSTFSGPTTIEVAAETLETIDREILTPLGPAGLPEKAIVVPVLKALKPLAAELKAAQLAKNVKQGAKAEAAVAEELGGQVAGQRVTLEASTGQRSVADFVTKDKGIVEVKSGGAQLSPGQKAIQADVQAGREVIPRGQNAANAGLEPGKSTQMKCFDVKRC